MHFYKNLKNTFLNLLKNIFFTLTSIIGLSSGFCVVIFIGLYIHYEFSYDDFLKDKERIYRVALHRIYPSNEKYFSTTSIQLAPAMQRAFPDVQAVTRLHRQFFENEISVIVDETGKTFPESRFLFADSSFFDVFSFQFLKGNPKQSLIWPYAVVLSRSTAMRYFGTIDALDKSISINGQMYLVSGVIEDIPKNAHMHFDLLGSLFALEALNDAVITNNWAIPWVYTYVKLNPDTDPKRIGFEIENILKTEGKESLKRDLGDNYEISGHFFAHFLQPIQSIHLTSNLEVELQQNGNRLMLWIVGFVGFSILILSSINFINLSISRIAQRSKEVGIRKVLGSTHLNIISQFLFEAFIITLISAVLAVIITYFTFPLICQLMGFTIQFQSIWETELIVIYILMILFISFFAGFFPATMLVDMEVSLIIKGVFQPRFRGLWMRKFLVGLQFFVSITMIALSMLVIRQISFIQSEPLGFSKEGILVVNKTDRFGIELEELVNHLSLKNEFLTIGSGSFVPGDFYSSNIFKIQQHQDHEIRANTCFADNAYFHALRFQLISGTLFPESDGDTIPILLNETAAKAASLSDPIGAILTSGLNEENSLTYYKVSGIIQDFHFSSMKDKIGALILIQKPKEYTASILVLRVNPDSNDQAVASLENSWKKFSNEELSYKWLSDNINDMYKPVQNMSRVFAIFTFIAIIISCTGLYGLATYKVMQRNREMVIRKVLGSKLTEIIWLFYQDFGKLIFYSFLISVPVSYIGFTLWVQSFAYQAGFSVFPFLITGIITLFLIIVSVSFQAIRLAYINPVEMLRND